MKVDVNVHVTGESAPGTIHVIEALSVTLEAEATNLPDVLEVSVEGLEAGTTLRGADLVLPEGSSFVGDPEQVILAISTPTVSAADEADEAAVEEQAAASAAAAEA